MKNKWLDLSVVYGLPATLCTTEAQFLREYKRMTSHAWPGPNKWCVPGLACVHALEKKTEPCPAMIVCIDVKPGANAMLSLSMLAHEATHIKQEFMKVIGEDAPSNEFEAYVIQNICQGLFDEFQRQRAGKKKKA